ncbi:hypothetical protein GRI89_09140 [Altererythrobacter salegens]|uniref:Uncharacterized protein n=1 Tax=Croceibacterium salegens TaxID=1737568 RepID=A0A6I4SZJ0_9SPHN|nr:hypothetical protein [Croceibacterium salegens]MXO59702.1 hypothetical protein [Croceibacterium salegens]
MAVGKGGLEPSDPPQETSKIESAAAEIRSATRCEQIEIANFNSNSLFWISFELLICCDGSELTRDQLLTATSQSILRWVKLSNLAQVRNSPVNRLKIAIKLKTLLVLILPPGGDAAAQYDNGCTVSSRLIKCANNRSVALHGGCSWNGKRRTVTLLDIALVVLRFLIASKLVC